jgi:hypothetical protein
LVEAGDEEGFEVGHISYLYEFKPFGMGLSELTETCLKAWIVLWTYTIWMRCFQGIISDV